MALSQEQLYQSVEGLRQSDAILFEAVVGSIAYGTNTPESDTDLRGVFIAPLKWHVGLHGVPEEVSIEKQDIKFYELKKFFKLATGCNPNIVELLFTPKDCLRQMTPKYQHLIDNRDAFMSRLAFATFSGYAYSQIAKAKGQNKMVHQDTAWEPGIELARRLLTEGQISHWWVTEKLGADVLKSLIRGQPAVQEFAFTKEQHQEMDRHLSDTEISRMVRPSHSQFCWFIPRESFTDEDWRQRLKTEVSASWPCRPVRHGENWGDVTLDNTHAAALEHTSDVFRLYHYGADAKGVFRGDDLLVCESIPVEDEWSRFRGLLLFNKNAYNQAVDEWKRYWQWRANRNETRWASKTGEKFEFDAKNLMHCMRLLWSGENLLKTGEPIVRFSGPKLDRLRLIRSGNLPYPEIMAEVEAKMEELKQVEAESPLPKTADLKRIDDLYLETIGWV